MPSPPTFPERTLLFFDWAKEEGGFFHLWAYPLQTPTPRPPVMVTVGIRRRELWRGDSTMLLSCMSGLLAAHRRVDSPTAPAELLSAALTVWDRHGDRWRECFVSHAQHHWSHLSDRSATEYGAEQT
mgnify:CR=1 FL=1